jgi:hypothetical protein
VAERPTWTEAGITVGGAIYQLCGYEDDRMLRGFTRPTARITRDL